MDQFKRSFDRFLWGNQGWVVTVPVKTFNWIWPSFILEALEIDDPSEDKLKEIKKNHDNAKKELTKAKGKHLKMSHVKSKVKNLIEETSLKLALDEEINLDEVDKLEKLYKMQGFLIEAENSIEKEISNLERKVKSLKEKLLPLEVYLG